MNNVYKMPALEDLSYLFPVSEVKEDIVSHAVFPVHNFNSYCLPFV
jgi:hypothetical protein